MLVCSRYQDDLCCDWPEGRSHNTVCAPLNQRLGRLGRPIKAKGISIKKSKIADEAVKRFIWSAPKSNRAFPKFKFSGDVDEPGKSPLTFRRNPGSPNSPDRIEILAVNSFVRCTNWILNFGYHVASKDGGAICRLKIRSERLRNDARHCWRNCRIVKTFGST